jgi:hypothetical protein
MLERLAATSPFLPIASRVASPGELRLFQVVPLPLYSDTPLPAKSATMVLLLEIVSTLAFVPLICVQVVPFQNQTPTGAPVPMKVATASPRALEASTTGL